MVILHIYIHNSTIKNISKYGLYLRRSNNCIISGNKLIKNGYGIYLSSSNDNLIYNNYFDNIINAYDKKNNVWNISKISGINIIGGRYLGGNYWHDYNGIDANGDGLGDTDLPYDCFGKIKDGGDYCPLVSTFSMMLYEGWNLITFPCKNNFTASSLFDYIDGCSIILSWNASEQNFMVYASGSPYDFAMKNGHGYIIGMENNTLFSIMENPVKNVSILLYIGWNMLGWFRDEQINASSLYDEIDNCTAILKWNNSVSDFDIYAPGVPDFIIKRGDGFLVSVKEEGIWYG